MYKHTPGPWFAGQLSDTHPPSLTVGTFEAEYHWEDSICEVWHGNHDAEANAVLIAAAPDLYEAVTQVELQLKVLERSLGFGGVNEALPCVQKLRKVCEKALSKVESKDEKNTNRCEHDWVRPQDNEFVSWGDNRLCIKCFAVFSIEDIENESI